MVYKLIEFLKEYKVVESHEQLYEFYMKNGKKFKRAKMIDRGGEEIPEIKTHYKVLYKKGDVVEIDSGVALGLIKEGYAKLLQTLVSRKIRIQSEYADFTDLIVKLGIEAHQKKEVKEKPAPKENKKDKGPKHNK